MAVKKNRKTRKLRPVKRRQDGMLEAAMAVTDGASFTRANSGPYHATKIPRNKEEFRQLLENIDDNSFHRGRQLGQKFAAEEHDKKMKEFNVEQDRQKREACIRLMNAAGQLTEALSKMVLSINGNM